MKHPHTKDTYQTTDDKNKASYYVYIVRCADNTLYIGFTTKLKQRIETHNNGKGAKYTKGRRPVVLCYFESFSSKSEALSREYKLKQLSRKQKEELINQDKSH